MIIPNEFEDIYKKNTYQQAADYFGVSKSVIKSWVKKLKLTKKTKPPLNEITELRKFCTIQQIADKYNVHFDTARKWVLGLPKLRFTKMPDNEIFIKLYMNNSVKKLAVDFEVSERTIAEWANKIGIKKGNIQKIQPPPKEELIACKKVNKLHEVAAIYGVSKTLISRWIKKIGLESRVAYNTNLPKSLTTIQDEIIIGSLLGDGCVSPQATSNSNCCFTKPQCDKRKEYLEWHFDLLKPYSSKLSSRWSKEIAHDRNGKIYILENGKNKLNWQLATVRHPIFTSLRHKWYPNDKKNIPDDIMLTPLTVAIWYGDDGHNSPTRRSCYFHTNGFTTGDCQKLINKLNDHLGIQSILSFNRNRPQIGVFGKNYFKLLEIIKPYFVWKCMQYKIDTSLCKPYVKLYNEI